MAVDTRNQPRCRGPHAPRTTPRSPLPARVCWGGGLQSCVKEPRWTSGRTPQTSIERPPYTHTRTATRSSPRQGSAGLVPAPLGPGGRERLPAPVAEDFQQGNSAPEGLGRPRRGYQEGHLLEGKASSPEMRRGRKQRGLPTWLATRSLIENMFLFAPVETGQGNDTSPPFLSLINKVCYTQPISLNQKSQIPSLLLQNPLVNIFNPPTPTIPALFFLNCFWALLKAAGATERGPAAQREHGPSRGRAERPTAH